MIFTSCAGKHFVKQKLKHTPSSQFHSISVPECSDISNTFFATQLNSILTGTPMQTWKLSICSTQSWGEERHKNGRCWCIGCVPHLMGTSSKTHCSSMSIMVTVASHSKFDMPLKRHTYTDILTERENKKRKAAICRWICSTLGMGQKAFEWKCSNREITWKCHHIMSQPNWC